MVLAYGVQQGAGVINQLANSNKPSPYPQNAGQAQYGAPGGHAQSYYQQGALQLFLVARKAKVTLIFAFSGQPQQQQNGYAPRTSPAACHREKAVLTLSNLQNKLVVRVSAFLRFLFVLSSPHPFSSVLIYPSYRLQPRLRRCWCRCRCRSLPRCSRPASLSSRRRT
jgi:hypothetical protein